jgi:phage/plasmid-like protein (TIGR03299 family)
MAHNINTYIGREAAWHALGTVTGKYQTWAEILAHGGLDFAVFKSQLRDGLGRPIKAWGTFRWNLADKQAGNSAAATFLGTVGEDYKVINHATGFELVDAMMQTADGAHYETAGVLGAGEVVWGLADLGLAARIGDDVQQHYLLFCTSHDGSYSYQLRHSLTRVVCQNTLNASLSEKGRASFKIRHTKSAMTRVAEAHKALEAIAGDVHSIEEKLRILADRRVTRESITTIMDRIFPKREVDGVQVDSTRRDNTIADVLALFENNDGDKFPEQRGTAYNLLNAVTEYTDHVRATQNNGRAMSAMFGSGDKLKSYTLQTILAEAPSMPMVHKPGVVVDFAELGLNVPVASMN